MLASVQFSHSVVSDSLWSPGPQHARPPYPSPTPGVYPNSCALSRWYSVHKSMLNYWTLLSLLISITFWVTEMSFVLNLGSSIRLNLRRWETARAFKPSLLFTSSILSNCLQSHGLQHARLPHLSLFSSLLKLMFIESVMSSSHLIPCNPLLLLPSISPSIRVFSNESVLHIRWPEYWY